MVNILKMMQKKNILIYSSIFMVSIFALVFAYRLVFSSGPVGVVKSYLSAGSWEDRLPYVLNPEKMKPMMKSYYKDVEFSKRIGKISYRPENDSNGFARVYHDKSEFEERSVWYTLKKTENGYLIDWEASVGYNPMTFKAFKAQKLTVPTKFRVIAKLHDPTSGTLKTFGYSREELYGISLYSFEGDYYFNGHIAKFSDDGRKIYEILKDGEAHELIVTISYPLNEDYHHIWINKFHKEGWVEE